MTVMSAVMYGAFSYIEDGNTSLEIVLWTAGAVLVLIILAAASAYASHRWTIEATGIRVEEKPKVPFLGLSRTRTVAFTDIAALRHIESALDVVIEIATRDGKAYRLMAQSVAAQDLRSFAADLTAAAANAGRALPSMTEELSFWNRPEGLFMIVVMQVVTIAIAAATAWALFDGGLNPTARVGEFAGIAIALPFGVAYLLYKSLTRRWRVLKLLAKND
jgi:hypothetical protein